MNSKLELPPAEIIATQQVCFIAEDAGGQPLQLGVEIALVREVLTWRHITLVPLAPEGVLGIFDWRGHIVPVLDLAWLLWQSNTPLSPRNRLLILEVSGGFIALVTSWVSGIIRTVGALESLDPDADLDHALVYGTIRSTLGPVILLNPKVILSGLV